MPINQQTGQWEDASLNTSWMPQGNNVWNTWDNDPYNPTGSNYGGSSMQLGAPGSNYSFGTASDSTPPPPNNVANGFGGLAGLAGNIQANPGNYFVSGSSNVGSGGLPPATSGSSSQGPPPPPPNPMSFFRTDLAPTYNGIQYANQAGTQRVASFLPGSQQTQTATAFGVAPQAITNYGGINMNTGLINNLINQYGEAQARAMIDAEVAAARRNGGGNYTVGGNVNDASLEGYLQRDPSLRSLATTTMPAAAPVTFNPSAYVQPTTPASTAQAFTQSLPQNVANNTAATTPAVTNTANNTSNNAGGMDMNQFFQLLMLMLGMGGLGGQNRTQAAGPTSRNPLWYSNYY